MIVVEYWTFFTCYFGISMVDLDKFNYTTLKVLAFELSSSITVSFLLCSYHSYGDRIILVVQFLFGTHWQFDDGTFDVVLDKGGLDALMEPEFGSELGDKYLSEVL